MCQKITNIRSELTDFVLQNQRKCFAMAYQICDANIIILLYPFVLYQSNMFLQKSLEINVGNIMGIFGGADGDWSHYSRLCTLPGSIRYSTAKRRNTILAKLLKTLRCRWLKFSALAKFEADLPCLARTIARVSFQLKV